MLRLLAHHHCQPHEHDSCEAQPQSRNQRLIGTVLREGDKVGMEASASLRSLAQRRRFYCLERRVAVLSANAQHL